MNDSSQETPHLCLLGVRIANLGRAEALDRLGAMVQSGVPHQVVTVNPEFLVQARELPAFRAVLNRAALALADGAGIGLVARLRGRRLRARLPGVDLMEALAAQAAFDDGGFFLLGAGPGVAAAAAAALQARHPGLRVAGVHGGSPDPGQDAATVALVAAARPRYLFVAFGAPQQDLWIARNLEALGVPLCMGVGGAFDFLSGRVPRAPRWMRATGLEWLYRLVREPWRWRRMLRLPQFLWLALTPGGDRCD